MSMVSEDESRREKKRSTMTPCSSPVVDDNASIIANAALAERGGSSTSASAGTS